MNKSLPNVINKNIRKRNIKDIVEASLVRQRAAERRFRSYGLIAISLGLLFILIMFGDIFSKGYRAYWQNYISVPITLNQNYKINDPNHLDILIKTGMQALFPEVIDNTQIAELNSLLSIDAIYDLKKYLCINDAQLEKYLLNIPYKIECWLPVSPQIDNFLKEMINKSSNSELLITNQQLSFLKKLASNGKIKTLFNTNIFRNGDSRSPDQAGICGALMGSLLTLLVTALFSFPIGIATAVYLEEFAPKNRWTNFIVININNLAAVPSIVFGILGLSIFINFAGIPRSTPLAGGLVLGLMILPVIIISARSALAAVPASIRQAALGIGASKLQVVLHHVLPLAMPGILTGSIIGMARALGESAPLIMIGMVSFIVDVPKNFFDPATVLPVQIYLWSDLPERAFLEKASAAIIVLLAFMLFMNAIAIVLRKRFERRW